MSKSIPLDRPPTKQAWLRLAELFDRISQRDDASIFDEIDRLELRAAKLLAVEIERGFLVKACPESKLDLWVSIRSGLSRYEDGRGARVERAIEPIPVLHIGDPPPPVRMFDPPFWAVLMWATVIRRLIDSNPYHFGARAERDRLGPPWGRLKQLPIEQRAEAAIPYFRDQAAVHADACCLLSDLPGEHSPSSRLGKKSRRGKAGDEMWREAMGVMEKLLRKGALPKTIRKSHDTVKELKRYSLTTLNTAAKRSDCLQIHFGLEGDASDSTDPLEAELGRSSPEIREVIERLSPEERERLREQLATMKPEYRIELLRSLSENPEIVERHRGTVGLHDIEDVQDVRDENFVPKGGRKRHPLAHHIAQDGSDDDD